MWQSELSITRAPKLCKFTCSKTLKKIKKDQEPTQYIIEQDHEPSSYIIELALKPFWYFRENWERCTELVPCTVYVVRETRGLDRNWSVLRTWCRTKTQTGPCSVSSIIPTVKPMSRMRVTHLGINKLAAFCKRHFQNIGVIEKNVILLLIWRKCVPKDPVDNQSLLV